MKRMLLCLIIIASVLCCITSCNSDKLGMTEHIEPYVILYNTSPLFFDYDENSRFDRVKLLEKDSCDRVLFAYLLDGKYSFLVICQKSEKESNSDVTVYWYDMCWLAKEPQLVNDPYHYDYADYSQDEIDDLKQANDWNQPLDLSKMNKAVYSNSREFRIDARDKKKKQIEDVKKACTDFYNLDDKKTGYIYNIVQRENLIFTILNARDRYYFLCYDLQGKEIIQSSEYTGDDVSCCAAFYEFVYSCCYY